MTMDSNIITMDTARMRPGMRSQAHNMIVEISAPENLSLWNPLPSSDPKRITSTEILGSLGSIALLWKDSDLDVAARIEHTSLALLFAIHSGQYRDPAMVEKAMNCQAAAAKVIQRLAPEGAQGDAGEASS
jgi:hypothetical protein